MGRSKNPDLIFDDTLKERAERVTLNYLGDNLNHMDLDRVTLFVTHKCNFKCSYCNGPHVNKNMDIKLRREVLKADVTMDQYEKWMVDWANHNLKNIHFTGGEATLHKDLPKMVQMATDNGILSTLTTNGYSDIDVYRELIDNGLTEFRISIDTMIEDEFDKIVGRKGAGHKVLSNIQELVKMRDEEGKDIYLIFNTCAGSFNIEQMKQICSDIISLNGDDAKLLIVAEQGEEVRKNVSKELVDELLEYVDMHRSDYILLKKKIENLAKKNTFGLKDMPSKKEIKTCFIPMTERTLDARYLYPCSIYLRYFGPPIARSDHTFPVQQKLINDFATKHMCVDDFICYEYCTSCCKEFNLEANRMVKNKDKIHKATDYGVIEVFSVENGESQKALNIFDEILSLNHTEPQNFLIIKPIGMKYIDEIKDYIKYYGISIKGEKIIEKWGDISLFLYASKNKMRNVDIKLARNKAYREFEDEKAMCLYIENGYDAGILKDLKQDLRNMFDEEFRFYRYKEGVNLLKSNCVHIPDEGDVELENKILNYFLE
ncbi:radical SAM protein [Nanoarchaeota archaeon]